MSIEDKVEKMGQSAEDHYAGLIAGESEYWDSFVVQRLLRGEMPGSIDFRIACTLNRYNNNWRPFCLGAPGTNFRMREVNYILTAATQRSGARVLELGCGAGWLSLELARLGAHVTGIDISPTNLAMAGTWPPQMDETSLFFTRASPGCPVD